MVFIPRINLLVLESNLVCELLLLTTVWEQTAVVLVHPAKEHGGPLD